MKVLWFTSTSSNFQTSNHNYNGCGWIASLEKLFLNDSKIEIGICFYFNKKTEVIKNKNITYFPIFKKRELYDPIRTIINNYIGEIEFSNLNRIIEVIESYKPDLIHVFGTENCFINIANHTKIPIVFHLQGVVNSLELNFFAPNTSKESIFYSKYFFIQNLLGISPYFQYKKWKNQSRKEKSILSHIKYISGRTKWDRSISKMFSSNSKYFHIDEVLRDVFYHSQKKSLINLNKKTIKIVSTISPSIYKGRYCFFDY